jgi:hypothetical protein
VAMYVPVLTGGVRAVAHLHGGRVVQSVSRQTQDAISWKAKDGRKHDESDRRGPRRKRRVK